VAAYPTYAQLEGSEKVPRDDIRTEYATDGTMKQRSFYTTIKSDFVVKHLLSPANAITYRAFYADNRTAANTFVWSGDAATYDVRFKGPYKEKWTEFGWQFEVELGEI
jgi:hypothetical protein